MGANRCSTKGSAKSMMQIVVDRDSATPIYIQIARQIRQAIVEGELAPGERLPPERRLAALLGVNRTTVVNAYRELAADGLVSGQVGRGTIVTHRSRRPGTGSQSRSHPVAGGHEPSWVAELETGVYPPQRSSFTATERTRNTPIPWPQLFTPATEVMNDPMLHDAMIVSARPDVIRLATGTPSPRLYPINTIRELMDEALHNHGQILLQHTPTEGYGPLREALAGWMADFARDAGSQLDLHPENVVVVAGSQQGLYLLARTLIEPGDLIAVESPTYLGAAQVFRAAGARLLPIPVDEDGMNVDLLQDLIPRRRPKLIYTLPTFQNPSGTVMGMGRRMRLLDMAARYQIPVIEDDPYGALRYEGRHLPTLAALDRSAGRQNVIYLSTVSKMLFPGFRLGWVAAAKPVVERITLMKQIVDLDTNALAQWAVWAFFERDLLRDHLAMLNRAYPIQRDRMLAALDRYGDGLITADRPDGGIYLWCKLNDGLRVRDLLPEAAREGVIFAPGESFHVDAASGRGRSSIRLNFTLPNDDEIDEGIRRLANALHRLAAQVSPDGIPARHQDALTPIV
jgi:2-aminoadipate transaminase